MPGQYVRVPTIDLFNLYTYAWACTCQMPTDDEVDAFDLLARALGLHELSDIAREAEEGDADT